MGLTPCKAEQLLQGMKLQEKETEKDRENLQLRSVSHDSKLKAT